MIWTLRARAYHCPPYVIQPGRMGWSVWLVGDKRLGFDLKSLPSAKALAKLHAQGEKRLPA